MTDTHEQVGEAPASKDPTIEKKVQELSSEHEEDEEHDEASEGV